MTHPAPVVPVNEGSAVLGSNAVLLEYELDWFRSVLDQRLRLHAGESAAEPLDALAPPSLAAADSAPYARTVLELGLDTPERLLLLLAFLPHLQPSALDPFFIQNRSLERNFTEFGGLIGNAHGGFLPTGETAMFLLAGDDLERRFRHLHLFRPDHRLYRKNVLRLEHVHRQEPALSAALCLSAEYRERLCTGESYEPPFSAEFPAKRIVTAHGWDDLVLPRPTRDEVDDIVTWARHRKTLLDGWGLGKRLKPGFRSLFYGPPGTGKTLTACLLGQAVDAPVYRVDLSRVVSKYIGETEKNLASLFDQAENQDWILFFDEADALFGRRTESRDANDRAANQQVAYLLQRIEDFPGIVILATNLRSHLDEAFARRFQSMIYFPLPDAELRLRLWRDCFEGQAFCLAHDVDLWAIAREHELSGGSIVNVLRYACLKAVTRHPREVRGYDLTQGIRRELSKEGKALGAIGGR